MKRWFRTALVPCACTVIAYPATGQPAPQEAGPRRDTALERRVDSLLTHVAPRNGPGCAVAVIERGVPVALRAAGDADLEHQVRIRPGTRFAIGSLSKQFTAFATWLLIADGRLTPDADVRRYVPELPAYARPITIRHLLQQTSGLRDAWNLTEMSGRWHEDPWTQADLLSLLTRQQGVNFPAGAQFEYSNSNYLLLAEVVRRVTGISLGDFAAQRIFRPLGMLDTEWPVDHTVVIRDRATSYVERGGGGYRTSRSNWGAIGAGGIVTSAEDLIRWEAHWHDPRTSGLGGRGLLDSMLVEGRDSAGRPTAYGSGLYVETLQGRRVARHGGSTVGYRSEVVRFVADSASVFALCNWPSTPRPAHVVDHIATHLLPRRESPTPAVALRPVGDSVALTEDAFAAAAGMYWNPSSGVVRELAWRRGRPAYVLSEEARAWLTPTSPTTFRFGSNRITVSGVSGRRELRVDWATGAVDRFTEFTPWTPGAAMLRQFAGVYSSDELGGAQYTIRADSGALVLDRRIGGGLRLRPVVPDVFVNGDVRVWFRRERGGLVGFRLSEGRVQQLRFTRAGTTPTAR